MRTTAFTLLLFIVALNLSLYLIAATNVLPIYSEAYDPPLSIQNRLIGGFTSFLAITLLAGVAGYLVYGASLGLILWLADMFMGGQGIISWALTGIPNFITHSAALAGVPEAVILPIYTVVNVLQAVVWLWFMIGLLAQRGTMEI